MEITSLRPEWWQNVPDQIKEAFAKVVDQVVDQRYYLEELKLYALEKNRVVLEAIVEQIKRGTEYRERVDDKLSTI